MDRKELEHCISMLKCTTAPINWIVETQDTQEYDQKMEYVKDYVYENIDTIGSDFHLTKKFHDNFCDWVLKSPPKEIDIQMLRKLCGDKYFIDKVYSMEFICYFQDPIFMSFDNYTPIYRQIFIETELPEFTDVKVTLHEKSVSVEYPYQTVWHRSEGCPGDLRAPDIDKMKKEVQENIEHMVKSTDQIIPKLLEKDPQGIKELKELIEEKCWEYCYLVFYKKLFDSTNNMEGWEDWYEWIDSSLYPGWNTETEAQ